MMKAKMGKAVVLGLTHANLARLKSDGLSGYIEVKGSDLGIENDILITAAETERDFLRHFADLIGPNTAVRMPAKLKD